MGDKGKGIHQKDFAAKLQKRKPIAKRKLTFVAIDHKMFFPSADSMRAVVSF